MIKCLKSRKENQSGTLIKFSFIFSPIFENRTFCTHTSICTKNVFLVILKSKYHSNIRFYFIIHRFIIIHFYTCHNASSLILWHFQRINQLYSIAKITFGSSTTEHFRLDSQVSNFKMKLFSSSDSSLLIFLNSVHASNASSTSGLPNQFSIFAKLSPSSSSARLS